MEKSTKILLAIGGTLVAGVGGYFIYKAATKPKSDNDADANKVGSITPITTITPPPLTPEQVGIPTINPASTIPSIPSLGDFNLGSFGTSVEPTPSEYIRMADRYMSWGDLWEFASKLGITDKDKVGGTTNAQDKGIISTASRRAFGEIVTKFPNWKTLFKAKAKEVKVPFSEDNFAPAQKYIKDTYGFEMAQFSGSNNNPSNFWTSKR